MPANPGICECDSQLFVPVWAVEAKDESDEKLDPKEGNTHKIRVGFKCLECEALQLTREVPQRHADDDGLDLPDAANRDMVREHD